MTTMLLVRRSFMHEAMRCSGMAARGTPRAEGASCMACARPVGHRQRAGACRVLHAQRAEGHEHGTRFASSVHSA